MDRNAPNLDFHETNFLEHAVIENTKKYNKKRNIILTNTILYVNIVA